MSELLEHLLARRSVRAYTGEPIPEDKLKTVLAAGLVSESGHNIKPWEFIVIRDRERLDALVNCKVRSGRLLEKAGAAIVVVADQKKSDIWIDDCAIAMANMHLTADSLGLGSCYMNARYRNAVDGGDTESFVKNYLRLPGNYRVTALLVLGIPAARPAAHTLDELDWSKVHYEQF